MNLKMSFLATLSVALFAVSANAEIIHESDFEAEPTTGFALGVETMGFNDCGGDLIGFSANGNAQTTGDSMGVTASNPNSGSFAYAVDVGVTDPDGTTGTPNGWGAAWCGNNTEGGSGGFTTQAAAEENGGGCYVDFSAGATFTATCQIATDALNPLTGTATGEIRLEFVHEIDPDVADDVRVADVIPRTLSPRLGVADLTTDYQEITVTYTLTQADIDTANAAGAPINSCAAVMGIEAAGHETSTGHILFDDFVFEVNSANVVVVGEGHATDVETLKGDVDLSGEVDLFDISPFIAVLTTPGSFQAEADVDCNGEVDLFDIAPFIDILTAPATP